MNRFSVTAKESGERIDALLARNGLTRAAAQRLLEAGLVTLSGAAVKKNRRTTAGECYEVSVPLPEASALTPQDIPLEVVFEDEDVIVVNKPRGLVVHPAPGHPDGTLVNAI
jgi:23S rRNA pseudouridine1911/1915/1917 synthase